MPDIIARGTALPGDGAAHGALITIIIITRRLTVTIPTDVLPIREVTPGPGAVAGMHLAMAEADALRLVRSLRALQVAEALRHPL